MTSIARIVCSAPSTNPRTRDGGLAARCAAKSPGGARGRSALVTHGMCTCELLALRAEPQPGVTVGIGDLLGLA